MEVSGQFHALLALGLGKEHLVPAEWEAGFAAEPFWTFGEEKKLSVLALWESLLVWWVMMLHYCLVCTSL
jgi:hypothetical protein